MTTRSIGKHHRVGRPTHRLRLTAIPIGLCLTVLIGACSSSGDDRKSSPATPAVPPQSNGTSTVGREEAAVTAYRGMWQAYAKAGLTANPQEPDLARFATGAALSLLTSGLAKLREDGEVIKGQYQSSPRVTAGPSPAPGTIFVLDCLNTTDFLTYKASSGALTDDTPGGNRAVRATVIRVGDVWKVSTVAAQAVGTC
ncbi:hypothetical protein [Micromonospora sp. HUAS LYJ1]|uniref:hypothetical protein n=1 Tax=Micromonospora sp. HUAS LYJ1 TaxID=3061626 RepID=UPI0026736994|nr:hypothetical protein [Micromonospora sp. HUAS LYJ1]WKU03394.1 hypothetical protein Q2K16_21405 [Micromonospora sp. HUAS LYJ1]